MSDRCPTCNSPSPERHPSVQFEGETEICVDAFHLRETNLNRPEYIAAVHAKRRASMLSTGEMVDELSKGVAASPGGRSAGLRLEPVPVSALRAAPTNAGEVS